MNPEDVIVEFHLPQSVRIHHDATTGTLEITGLTSSIAAAMAAELEGLARDISPDVTVTS